MKSKHAFLTFQFTMAKVSISISPRSLSQLSITLPKNNKMGWWILGENNDVFPVQTVRLSRLSICLLPSISYSIWLLMYWEEKVQK